MKFFHLADLHLGKKLYDIDLAGDQLFWIDAFLQQVDIHHPQAVVISGDVFDSRDHAPEAHPLLNRLLSGLVARGVCVFMVAGNHDNSVRLSYAADLLQTNHIYISGTLTRDLTHVTLPGEVPVTFWLMPFLYPSLAASDAVLARDDLHTYDAAVRALLALQPLDETGVNVLVAHQNVLSGSTRPQLAGSESIIGGLGEIESSAFDAFDYVALGHIHNRQHIGRETVRYAGCPLYYDFSEVDRDKRLTLVEVTGKGNVTVSAVDIPLKHRLWRMQGTLEEVLAAGRALPDKNAYYYQVILTDATLPQDCTERLQSVFGPAVSITRSGDALLLPRDVESATVKPEESTDRQFARFWQYMTDSAPTEAQTALVAQVLEQQSRAGCYYTSPKLNGAYRKELLDDADELLSTLLRSLKEVDA